MNLCVSKYSTTSKGRGHEEREKTSPQVMGEEMAEGNHSAQHLGIWAAALQICFFFFFVHKEVQTPVLTENKLSEASFRSSCMPSEKAPSQVQLQQFLQIPHE